MSREIPFEAKCPTHKVQLEYKGMEDVHTGGIGLEVMELIGTFLWGGAGYGHKGPVGKENNL